MNQLTEYILETDGRYVFKVATADWHPHNHCSFDINGGQWSVHCVQHSVGATIWPALFDAIQQYWSTLRSLNQRQPLYFLKL